MTKAPNNLLIHRIAARKAYEQGKISFDEYQVILSELDDIECDRKRKNEDKYDRAKKRLLQKA